MHPEQIDSLKTLIDVTTSNYTLNVYSAFLYAVSSNRSNESKNLLSFGIARAENAWQSQIIFRDKPDNKTYSQNTKTPAACKGDEGFESKTCGVVSFNS